MATASGGDTGAGGVDGSGDDAFAAVDCLAGRGAQLQSWSRRAARPLRARSSAGAVGRQAVAGVRAVLVHYNIWYIAWRPAFDAREGGRELAVTAVGRVARAGRAGGVRSSARGQPHTPHPLSGRLPPPLASATLSVAAVCCEGGHGPGLAGARLQRKY